MIVIPAIDLKDGKVVRLTQGRFDETIYSTDPVKIAKIWKSEGAKVLHCIDLDGAISGTPKNLNIVQDICQEVGLSVQFGGGLRDRNSIFTALTSGITKVIIGTKALDEEFLKSVIAEFKDKVIVSIDVNKDKIFTDGWLKNSPVSVMDLVKKLKTYGLKTLIVTDVSRDGTMKGPNLDLMQSILIEGGISLIVAGGIGSIEDIKKISQLLPSAPYGAIIGKAIYEGKFKFYEAVNAVKNVG